MIAQRQKYIEDNEKRDKLNSIYFNYKFIITLL